MRIHFLLPLLYVLVPGLLLGFLGGRSLGHTFWKEESPPHPTLKTAFISQREEPSLHREKSQQNDFRKTKLDIEFARISSLSVPQIVAEMDVWNKKRSQAYPSHGICTASDYLAWRLGKEAPRQALQELKKYPDLLYHTIYPLMEGWAQKNPDDAINWFTENKAYIFSHFLLSSTMACTFVKANPDKTLDWIKSMDDDSQGETALAAFEAVLAFHPDKTKDYIAFLRANDLAGNILSEELAKKDWEATVQLISSSPENSQTSMWSSALGALAEINPDKAIQEWKKQDSASKDKMRSDFMQSLLRNYPVKAFEWLTTQVTEEQAAQLLNENRFLHIYHFDSPAFQQYVDKMPLGKLKDAVLEKMINSCSSAFRAESNFENYQPEMVFSWIDSMNDEEKKLSYVNKYLSDWEDKSPANVLQ